MKKLDFKLPDELENVLDSLEYEEEGGIVVRNVRYGKDGLTITLHVFCSSIDVPVQIWDVRIVDVKKHKVTIAWSKDFNFYSGHFLLNDYHDDYAELYFTGASDNVDEIFVDIYRQLLALGGSNIDISPYIFSPQRLDILCKQGYGLFARGSKSILLIYENALSKQGIKTNYIS